MKITDSNLFKYTCSCHCACLFADNCLLYRIIQSERDIATLQSDFNSLAQWSHIWQMNFNIGKCIVIKCSRDQTITDVVNKASKHLTS